jgi:large subunit ribosomal protein L22
VEIKAELKYVRVSPRKMKLLMNTLRVFPVDQMIERLKMLNKSGGLDLLKLIESARSNAENNFHLSREVLKIKELSVRSAGGMKRQRAASRGVGHGYKKRMSHIKIVLEG